MTSSKEEALLNANPQERNIDGLKMGNTPLISLAIGGFEDAMIQFLNKNTNYEDYINLTDTRSGKGYHNTALIAAAFGCYTGMAFRLIDCGADVTIANTYGTTALHYACIARDHELIIKLIDHGARLDAMNAAGVTPLDFYLYDFDGTDYEIRMIREIELMGEHLSQSLRLSKLYDERPKIQEGFLTYEQISVHQNAIPDLMLKNIGSLISHISPVFISNSEENFKASPVHLIYEDYAGYQESWRAKQTKLSLEDARAEMLEEIKELFQIKYDRSKTQIGMDNQEIERPGASMAK